jgi:hypothetical protein
MACCCGPQVCLCSTPANGAKATQVLVEFLNFTYNGGARAVWHDFASSTITNYLNGLSLYCAIVNPQPAYAGSRIVYRFSASYSPGYCEVSGVSLEILFGCSNGAGAALGVFGFGFRRDAEPQRNPQGTAFISRCGACGSAFTPDTCDGSGTFGTPLPTPPCNVCTMASGTSFGWTLAYIIGPGNDFDIANYTGDIRYTPL